MFTLSEVVGRSSSVVFVPVTVDIDSILKLLTTLLVIKLTTAMPPIGHRTELKIAGTNWHWKRDFLTASL